MSINVNSADFAQKVKLAQMLRQQKGVGGQQTPVQQAQSVNQPKLLGLVIPTNNAPKLSKDTSIFGSITASQRVNASRSVSTGGGNTNAILQSGGESTASVKERSNAMWNQLESRISATRAVRQDENPVKSTDDNTNNTASVQPNNTGTNGTNGITAGSFVSGDKAKMYVSGGSNSTQSTNGTSSNQESIEAQMDSAETSFDSAERDETLSQPADKEANSIKSDSEKRSKLLKKSSAKLKKEVKSDKKAIAKNDKAIKKEQAAIKKAESVVQSALSEAQSVFADKTGATKEKSAFTLKLAGEDTEQVNNKRNSKVPSNSSVTNSQDSTGDTKTNVVSSKIDKNISSIKRSTTKMNRLNLQNGKKAKTLTKNTASQRLIYAKQSKAIDQNTVQAQNTIITGGIVTASGVGAKQLGKSIDRKGGAMATKGIAIQATATTAVQVAAGKALETKGTTVSKFGKAGFAVGTKTEDAGIGTTINGTVSYASAKISAKDAKSAIKTGVMANSSSKSLTKSVKSMGKNIKKSKAALANATKAKAKVSQLKSAA